MFELSEPLPGSKSGSQSIHEILMDGKKIGTVEVNYLDKAEAKTFGKYSKRKLKVGQPFGVRVMIESTEYGVGADQLGQEGMRALVDAVTAELPGLEDRDMYVLEITSKGKKMIGRGSQL